RKRAVCVSCGTIFYENPKIVAGCLLTWKDKILLCRRANEPRSGFWTLPAGFMENNETVEEGALRETMEEAGAKSNNIKLFLMCNLPHISQVYMMYYGHLDDGIYEAGLESLEVKLFTKEEIPWKDLAFTVIEKTIKLYYQDLEKGNIGIHFDTIMKK
ncbi:MAG: NUDIX domain-containing protein, partial [Gammaproteobacteria bacterium]|nr:NUDIX domain-containing protein [Gammaproteobacteria bacterium]